MIDELDSGPKRARTVYVSSKLWSYIKDQSKETTISQYIRYLLLKQLKQEVIENGRKETKNKH